jgi:uncharacterized membrane protein HdeD (DUF308 family)
LNRSNVGEAMVMPLLLEGLQGVVSRWRWILAWGILMIVLGLVALATPFTVSLGTTLFVGWMILLGGIIELGTTFSARGWQGVLFYLLVGILDILFGLLVISRPIEALGMFTLFFAAMLFVAGVFRACLAVFTHAPNWWVSLLSGIVSILCGVMIAAEWPESAIWVVGTFVGVSLVMRGVSTTSLAWGLRKLDQRFEGRRKEKPAQIA